MGYAVVEVNSDRPRVEANIPTYFSLELETCVSDRCTVGRGETEAIQSILQSVRMPIENKGK